MPSKIISKIFLNDDIFKPSSTIYFNKLNLTLQEHKRKYLSGIEAQINEIKFCLKIRTTLKYLNVLNLLRDRPHTLNELSSVADDEIIQELIESDFIIEIKTKIENYYALLTDIRIKKFTPNYLILQISQKFNNNEIDKETALDHFNFLFDSEVTS